MEGIREHLFEATVMHDGWECALLLLDDSLSVIALPGMKAPAIVSEANKDKIIAQFKEDQ